MTNHDASLLREYARDKSEDAFAALVSRYVSLVYSVALRQTGSPHAAEEITQAVFIILARKAASLRPNVILSGWLYRTARLTAANHLRTERRRAFREQEAYMQSLPDDPAPDMWAQIAPLLDDALAKLGATDRHAILLRFFENKTLAQVGAALGASEDAAKMRVNRALEKLRKMFIKRGATLSRVSIAAAISANSVHAAPTQLGVSITAMGAGKAAASASVAGLIKASLQQLFWLKLRAVLVVMLGVSLIGVGVSIQRQHAASGLAVIKLKLTGTTGLPFEVVYSADGNSQTAKGVLPGEVVFKTDAFKATLNVQGPGEFGFEVYRSGARRLSVPVAPFTGTRNESIEGLPGGAEIICSGRRELAGKGIVHLSQSSLGSSSTTIDTSPAGKPSTRKPAIGPAVIKFKLLGTVGMPFELTYSSEGESKTVKGVLPDEVSFNADAFNVTIKVNAPGEFGFELYRGEWQQAASGPGPITNARIFYIEAKAGGAGMSLNAKSE